MDLISREAVDNAMYDYCHACDVNESQMENYFCDLPSAFEGMTNGEVIISLYPDLKYTIQNGRVVTTIGVASSFDLEWWNAPYKAESEGTE